MSDEIDKWDYALEEPSKEDLEFYEQEVVWEEADLIPKVLGLKRNNYSSTELERLSMAATHCASYTADGVNQIEPLLNYLINAGLQIADHSEKLCRIVFARYLYWHHDDKFESWEAVSALIALLERGLKIEIAQKYYDYMIKEELIVASRDYFFRKIGRCEKLEECGLNLRGLV